jgi:NAD dependent epimerase/dehydratase family enzyme
VAPQIIDNEEFTRALAVAVRRPAILPVPSLAMKFVFGEDRAVMLLEGQKVLPAQATKVGSGFSPQGRWPVSALGPPGCGWPSTLLMQTSVWCVVVVQTGYRFRYPSIEAALGQLCQ